MADHYGINPFGLSEEQLLALEANIPRLQARRTRRDLQFRGDVTLPSEAVYDLIFMETGSKEAAEEGTKRYVAAQLRTGQTPE